MRLSKLSVLGLSVLQLLLLSSCSSAFVDWAQCRILGNCPTSGPPSGDCMANDIIIWNVVAKTWHDKNGNRAWDQDETPVAYVPIIVDNDTHVITNAEGVANVDLWLGCNRAKTHFSVDAEAPPGYQHTTPGHLDERGGQDIEPILFGLMYDPSLPQPTARPRRALTCRAYPGYPQELGDRGEIISAPDGTLFTYQGANDEFKACLFQFDFQSERWVERLSITDFNLNVFRAVSAYDLWVIGYPLGLHHFDGTSWTYYPAPRNLDAYPEMAVDAQGNVWIGEGKTLTLFQASSGEWKSTSLPEGMFYGMDLHLASDGSVWVVGDRIIHLASPQSGYGQEASPLELPDLLKQESPPSETTYHATAYDLPKWGYNYLDSALGQDGSLWIALQDGSFYRFDTRNMLMGMEDYSFEATAGARPQLPFEYLEAAGDGSIWAQVQSEGSWSPYGYWLVHFIPGSSPHEGQWIVHEGGELPEPGWLEAVDRYGGVWLMGENEPFRCVER